MKKSALLLMFALLGCGSKPAQTFPFNGPAIVSGPGYVRSVDWYHVRFIHETDQGFQKVFDICGPMPVWQGEHANIHFHWFQPGDMARGCDVVDSVEHLRGDVKE